MNNEYWMGMDDYYRSLEPGYETEEDYNELYSRPIEYSQETLDFIEQSRKEAELMKQVIWEWITNPDYNNQDYDIDAEWSYVNELPSGD